MNRILTVLAATLLACASQQKTSVPSASSPVAEDRTSVVQPSSLSPEQIRMLQRSLIDRGFAVDLSGNFDQPTQTALSEFQRARGLPATGNLNAPTIDALGLDPRDVMPVRSGADAAPVPGGAATGTSGPATPADRGAGVSGPATPTGPSTPPAGTTPPTSTTPPATPHPMPATPHPMPDPAPKSSY